MKKEELTRLLEKYYEGSSTEEEEMILRAYFSKNINIEGYEAEKAIFGYFMTSGEVPEPTADFEAKILAGVGESEGRRKSHRFRKVLFISLSTAAGLLLIAASYFFLVHGNGLRDTYSDPKLAYAETMKILLGVSSQLNKGAIALEPVAKINEETVRGFKEISKSTMIVEKNIKRLRKSLEPDLKPAGKNKNK